MQRYTCVVEVESESSALLRNDASRWCYSLKFVGRRRGTTEIGVIALYLVRRSHVNSEEACFGVKSK